MNIKARILPFLFISVLFTSCFNGLKSPKETIVSFNMDESTVRKIVELSGTPRNPSRAADDTNGAEIFIDVTLCGDLEQTKTAPLTDEIKIDFENVLVNSRVYAKAQVYKYIDAAKTQKEVFYRGESNTIVVHEGVNAVSIKLTNATLTVTFESNGGTQIEEVKVLTGAAVKEPETPVKPVDKKKYSKENYAFAGWYKDAELTQAYNFALPVKDDLTLYAKWLPGFVFVEGSTVNNYLAANRNLKISDLYVSDHEVSQAEYYEVTGKNPSNHTVSEIEEYPVENVTWFDAIEYCNLLSIKEGLTPCYTINGATTPADWGTISSSTQVSFNLAANGYRLPTEAEWEYVAEKSFRSNVDFGDIALYSENSMNSTWQIDNRKADELGLNSILGNVAEWCFDAYSDSITRTTGASGPTPASNTAIARVVRGGSYQSSKADCSSSVRASADQASKSPAIGFRVVRKVVNEYKVVTSKVTFVTNGGSSVETQSVIEGDTATQPADPTKTGYIFKGWNYAGEDFEFSTPITQDITLEAKWTAIKYTIRFNKGASSTSITMPDQVFSYDEEKTLSENTFAAPEGYKFGGWSLENHSTVPATISAEYQDKKLVKNLSAIDGTEITLYALWVDKDQCTITYNLSDYDTSTLTPVTYYPSQTISLPVTNGATLSREGYIFDGWYEASDYSGAPITGWSVNEKEADLPLYGRWNPITYKIKFISTEGTGSMTELTMTYDTPAALTTCSYSVTGKSFAGWSVSSLDNTITYTDGQMISTNLTSTQDTIITLYAVWSEHAPHTITYNNISGITGITNSNPTTFLESQSVTIANVSGTRTGYDFGGWYNNHDGDNNGTGTKITGWASGTYDDDVELWAKWTLINYTLTFDLKDGSWKNSYTAPANYNVTQNITLPDENNIERTGYDFGGWYIGSDTTNIISGWTAGERTDAGGLTLNAKWIPGTVTYTIEHYFEPDTDTTVPTDTSGYQKDDSITEYGVSGTTGQPTNATPKTVGGFTARTVSQQTIAADSSTVVKIYYDRKTITYTFNKASGETWPDTETANGVRTGLFGTSFTAPVINKTAYDFVKWNPDDASTILMSNTEYTFASTNKTYDAVWTPTVYNIIYSSNIDPVPTGFSAYPTTFTIESGTVTLHPSVADDIHNDDYYFDGWYTDDTYTTQVTTIDPTLEENRTTWQVIAKWVYKVNYKNALTGSTISTVKYLKDTKPTKPANPTYTGYVFDNWYTDNTCYTAFDFNQVYTGVKEVYGLFINSIYVEDSSLGVGSDDNSGRKDSAPVASIDTAISRIIEFTTNGFNTSGIDWTINVTGEVRGKQTISSDLTSTHAKSITIQGTNGDTDVDILDANVGDDPVSGGSTLAIGTSVPVTIRDIQITGGKTIGNGGGVNIGATAMVTFDTGTLITGNIADGNGGSGTAGNGGGVYVDATTGTGSSQGKLLILSGAVISNNIAQNEGTYSDRGGGGIYNKGIVSMRGGTISGNCAEKIGGGVLNAGNNMLNARFYMSGNAVIGDTGSHTPYYAQLAEGTHSNYVSSTSGNGGGIYNYDGTVKLGTYYDFETGAEGEEALTGGIYYNYAYSGGGIYNRRIYNASGILEMKSGTIANNGAAFGGGVYNDSGYTYNSTPMHTIFDMQGGSIETNKVHRNGSSGVVRGGGVLLAYSSYDANYTVSELWLSGSANIPASSDSDNYISLDADNEDLYITIKGQLSNSGFKIQMGSDSYYTSGRRVIYNGASLGTTVFANQVAKFSMDKASSTISSTGVLQ